MPMIKIKGVGFDVEDAGLAVAIQSSIDESSTIVKDLNAKVDNAISEKETLQGKFDVLSETAKKAESSKMDTDTINKLVQETVTVATQAKKLDPKFDTAGLDVMSIMRGVLGAKTDEKSDDYIRGMFAMKMDEMHEEKAGDLNKSNVDEDEEEKEDEKDPREKFKKKMLDKKKRGN